MNAGVSQRARNGFDCFIAQAARAALSEPGSQCDVTPVDGFSEQPTEVAMLTVSTYSFRILLFLHFNDDTATRKHFALLTEFRGNEFSAERFLDAVQECGNLLCGGLNRELAQYFPHIGMSTPCLLNRAAVEHLESLQPSWVRRYRAEVSEMLVVPLTLVLCAHGDLDFPFERRSLEKPATGEVEVF